MIAARQGAPLRVVVADGVSAPALALLKRSEGRLGVRIDLLDSSQSNGPEMVGAEVLVLKRRQVNAADLQVLPRLRGVQKLGVVTDNLDEGALRDAGIRLRTLVLPSAVSVADHTLALILAVARNIRQGMEAVLRGSDMTPVNTSENEVAFNWANLPTWPLSGRRLGLFGFGEIGYQVAKRARAFGLTVSYHKRTPLPKDLERRFGVTYVSLDSLLRESDVVSLHAPHTAETHQILNRERLLSMKSHAILINTSRGGLVDEDALVEIVRDGHLAGIGLDTFQVEPLPPTSGLLGLKNAVLSPHLAGAGPEALAQELSRALKRWSAESRRERAGA